jgi:hypothetical protein
VTIKGYNLMSGPRKGDTKPFSEDCRRKEGRKEGRKEREREKRGAECRRLFACVKS